MKTQILITSALCALMMVCNVSTVYAQETNVFGAPEAGIKDQEVSKDTADVVDPYNAEGPFPMKRTFRISAYYSPLPGQLKYATGSYEKDLRLNGFGVHGADGTDVFPGMIAAPKSYPFGTKMNIPGIGVVSVHDRGGAIVHSGERGNSHDRLDIWMGYGDKGLRRALDWGKRTLTVTIYGVDSTIKEEVLLTGYSPAEKYEVAQATSGVSPQAVNAKTSSVKFLTTQVAFASTLDQLPNDTETKSVFYRDLKIGDTGSDVRLLQEELKRMNLFGVECTGIYGEITQHAVFKFQQTQQIVSDSSDAGAGVFGVITRKNLLALMDERAKLETARR